MLPMGVFGVNRISMTGLFDEQPLGEDRSDPFGIGPGSRTGFGRREGDRVHGELSSSGSSASLQLTPTTCPVRVASRAIRSTVGGSIRETEAREAH
jgi:hypothetical protein